MDNDSLSSRQGRGKREALTTGRQGHGRLGDVEVWGTTADLGFPVTKDKVILKSSRDVEEGRRTNFIISPEIPSKM